MKMLVVLIDDNDAPEGEAHTHELGPFEMLDFDRIYLLGDEQPIAVRGTDEKWYLWHTGAGGDRRGFTRLSIIPA